MQTNAENFVNTMQTSRLWGANLWTKFQIFDGFGGCIPTFLLRWMWNLAWCQMAPL